MVTFAEMFDPEKADAKLEAVKVEDVMEQSPVEILLTANPPTAVPPVNMLPLIKRVPFAVLLFIAIEKEPIPPVMVLPDTEKVPAPLFTQSGLFPMVGVKVLASILTVPEAVLCKVLVPVILHELKMTVPDDALLNAMVVIDVVEPESVADEM